MKKLLIEETEWSDKTNFLYVLTPDAVKQKVEHYLSHSDIPPLLTKEVQEQFDDTLNFADELMYCSQENIKDATEHFNNLCDAICYLAFLPYGVEIFGHRYEVIDGSIKA